MPNLISTYFSIDRNIDDIAISFSDKTFGYTDQTLTCYLIAFNNYFKKWRLVPSSKKIEVPASA